MFVKDLSLRRKPALKEVLVLKHVPNEDAGTLADFLKKKKIQVRRVALYDGQKLPAGLERVRAVLVMGGPMNVAEEDKYPFLKEENVFIKKILDAGIPCMGICLGAQLVAKALGAKVYKAKAPEVGWMDVTLTRAAKKDPLFSLIKSPRLKVLQWHGDTFDIPKAAVRLAKSRLAPNQAYRYKKNVYALQFHLEADCKMLKDWFKKSKDSGMILEEYSAYQKKLRGLTDALYEKFFSL
jgi:GMP synthase (glutamine-hydrolysing)